MIEINIKIKLIDELEIISKQGIFPFCLTSYGTAEKCVDIGYGSGVYILYKDGEVVRVGQAKDVGKRLINHNSRNKWCRGSLKCWEWDSFSFIECNDDYTKFITEAAYILLYRPKHNKKISSIL